MRAPQINDLIATGGVAHCVAFFLLGTAGDATRLDWRGNRVSDCAVDVRLVRRPARPARHQLHYRAPMQSRSAGASVGRRWLVGWPPRRRHGLARPGAPVPSQSSAFIAVACSRSVSRRTLVVVARHISETLRSLSPISLFAPRIITLQHEVAWCTGCSWVNTETGETGRINLIM